MKRTYVYKDGKMVEKATLQAPEMHFIQDDIKPYKSMIDGRMISSRSQHKRHLKAHGCIEVGNESMETNVRPSKDSRKEVLAAQLSNMTHKEANRLLDKVRDDLRFTNYPHRRG
jgi:hypothetical protein